MRRVAVVAMLARKPGNEGLFFLRYHVHYHVVITSTCCSPLGIIPFLQTGTFHNLGCKTFKQRCW